MKRTSTHNNIIGTKEFIANYFAVLIYVVLVIILFMTWDKVPSEIKWYEVISWIAIVSYFIQIFLIVLKYKSVLCFEFVFVTLNQLFAFGRIHLLSWGKNDYIFWDLMVYYSELEKWRSGLIALVLGFGMSVGFLLFNKNTNKEIVYKSEDYSSKQQFYAGLIFFIVTEPITLYVAFKNVSAVQVAGRYADAQVNGVISCLSIIATAGIIVMITSYYLRKNTACVMMLLYDFISLLLATYTGDRRYAVTSILVTVLVFLFVYNIKIRPLRLIVYALVGLLVLMFIMAIRDMRNKGVISFQVILDYIISSENSIFDVLFSSMSEFGITFFTYTEAVVYYPNVIPYKLGITYLLGPLTLIPGIGKLIPSISSTVSVPAPIEELVQYSVGGSFCEELYGNFGLFSLILVIPAGYLIAFALRKEMDERHRGYGVARYYISFYFFINLVRASFNELLRSYVWTFTILYVIFHLFFKKDMGEEE